ncbi:hypothetical protein PCASD_20227 [Puccinia coronata f. sp. avenae]|uniref:Uncharacterized protein n=1 Tax=Puccinia coronata f. sp. avenae TaxID=200324 RepID=A0A2N5TVZ3_9BASI|nr:hypothetical protein PCASD_20227 [Puccinia coronata f. sp. avenae]
MHRCHFHPTDAEKSITTTYLLLVPFEQLGGMGEMFKQALADEAALLDMERGALKMCNTMEAAWPELRRYKTLAACTAEERAGVFKKWLVDPPSTCIIGRPLAKMSDQPEVHRKQRVQDTRQKYGPVGLQKLADKLAHAQQANDRPHPDSFIANFPVPTLQSIQWIDVQIAKGTEPPSYEHQFLHSSQNRLHRSDVSHPSPGMSSHSLPHPVSPPSTSSSLTNQQSSLSVASQQQVRRPHHVDSPSGSPDRPRLYQPEPHRVAMSSPNLQLQSSPRHQNTNIYPYQATSKRPSQQQAMSNSAHHFRPIPPCPFERYSEQLHSSSAGPSRHHSLRSTDLSTNSLLSRQSQPQPMYMHELSPRFQQHHGPSPQVESSSRRSENSLRERSHQPLSQELVQQQSPRTVQHMTYYCRDHLASPMVIFDSRGVQPSRTSSSTYSHHVPHPTPTAATYLIQHLHPPLNITGAVKSPLQLILLFHKAHDAIFKQSIEVPLLGTYHGAHSDEDLFIFFKTHQIASMNGFETSNRPGALAGSTWAKYFETTVTQAAKEIIE